MANNERSGYIKRYVWLNNAIVTLRTLLTLLEQERKDIKVKIDIYDEKNNI